MPSIASPKVQRHSVGRASWYPYYAGFSPTFAASALAGLSLPVGARVLDPWNGAGTTSQVASQLGLEPYGVDINPAMVIIAKARLLDTNIRGSLRVLGTRIVQRSKTNCQRLHLPDEPLEMWFSPASAAGIRAIERAIRFYLVASVEDAYNPIDVNQLSSLASFYYVAAFRAVRHLLRPFQTSNPTWLRTPATHRERVRPSVDLITEAFAESVRRMTAAIGEEGRTTGILGPSRAIIEQGDSRGIALGSQSIQAVLTSPPYCTRLDYAIATRIELAVLGHTPTTFRALRERMLGTAVIASQEVTSDNAWGLTCRRFLKAIAQHRSKSSASYYLKTHLQYFDGLFRSIQEIARVLQPRSPCILVVQDSHYKEIHNDLPLIATEMASACNLSLKARQDFPVVNNLATSHPHTRKYRPSIVATESVLAFTRAA